MCEQTRFDQRVPNRYETEKDLSERLSGTICRYRGEPVYVRYNNVEELWLNEVTKPSASLPKFKISPDDPEFDISSIELGYMNLADTEKKTNEALYVRRAPNRQYQQGLSGHYLMVGKINGDASQDYAGSTILFTEGMKESLSGVFPSPEEAMGLLSSVSEIAISQDIAIQKLEVGVLMVYYRTVNVGWAPPESKTINLADNSLRWVVERHMGRFNWIVK